jgi:hypothetical protein
LDSHRVFDRCGFNLPKKEIERTPARAVINCQEWTFEPTSRDWTNTKTGESLTGYSPPFQLEN